MTKNGSGNKCEYYQCVNYKNKNAKNLVFFRFPGKDNRKRQDDWIINSGNLKLFDVHPSNLSNKRLCQLHFLEQDIIFPKLSNHRVRLVSKTVLPIKYNAVESSSNKISSQSSSAQPELSSPKQILPIDTIDSNLPSTPKQSSRKRTLPSDIYSSSQPCSSLQSPHATSTPQISSIIDMPSPPPPKKKKLFLHKDDTDTPIKAGLKSHIAAQNVSIKKKNGVICKLKFTLNQMKKSSKISHIINKIKYRTPSQEVLIKMQLLRQKRRKWTAEEKDYALRLFDKSPSAYSFLRKEGIILPAESTIRRWLSKINFRPGFNNALFNNLKNKFENESSKMKSCALLFDEMAIKECLEYEKNRDYIEGFEDLGEYGRSSRIANHALVLMARGIHHNWKIPIAYFLVRDTVKPDVLAEIIKTAITKLVASNLEPKITVCDQSGTNIGAYKKLGVSAMKPFFKVESSKIYALYDIPHLFKSLRNNLLNGDYINSKDERIKFNDIRTAYFIDRKNKKSRSLSKLTNSHVSLKNMDKMNVKKAVQVLSFSVAKTIRTCIKTGEMESKTALNTANFVEMANALFDSLNSKQLFDVNWNRSALRKDKCIPRSNLIKGRDYFSSLKKQLFKNQKFSRPRCFDGLTQTIRGILNFTKNDKTGKFWCLNQFNQDPLENLFSLFRRKGGFNRNPTARTLRTSFRSRFVLTVSNSLPSSSVSTGNCEMDRDHFIDFLNLPDREDIEPTEMMSENGENEADEDGLYEDGMEVDNVETSPSEETLEKASISYFAGRLLQNLSKTFDCSDCVNALTALTIDDSCHTDLILFRNYESKSGKIHLKLPKTAFAEIFDRILSKFCKYYDGVCHETDIRKKIISQIEKDAVIASWLNNKCKDHRMHLLSTTIKIKIFDETKKRNVFDETRRTSKNKIFRHQ